MNNKTLEQIVKGFANHYRIDILMLLRKRPGLSLEEIAESVKAEYKTIAVHVNKVTTSGLVTKKYHGRRVEHHLTKRGEYILTFLRKLV